MPCLCVSMQCGLAVPFWVLRRSGVQGAELLYAMCMIAAFLHLPVLAWGLGA